MLRESRCFASWWTCLSCGLVASLMATARGEDVVLLSQAHAHNDYLHDRPLLDAVAQRFGSVEADVFLIDGQLLVAHTRAEIRPERTLQALYLDPLRERLTANAGSVYGDGQPFTLMIDIKSSAEATYQALDRVLSGYGDVLTSVTVDAGGVSSLHPGAVQVIVSGNRAVEEITKDATRYVGIDGRLGDLQSDAPAHLLPLISDNWNSHFTWRGAGPLPAAERQRLEAIVTQAHAKQRRVRFWAIPDQPAAWRVMREAGVDLINTDDLPGLGRFLSEQP